MLAALTFLLREAVHEHDLCTCNHFRYEHRYPYETISEICIGFEMKTPAKYEEDHDV